MDSEAIRPVQTIHIPADGGVQLHAWVFRPPAGSGAAKPLPAITMCHGFAAPMHRGLPAFAERFAAAGFLVIVHEHRNFGGSGGACRGDIDPWRQIEDWRRVVAYLQTRDDVDASRIGLWGTSYSGGHALVMGATDSRVRVVVSQVPTISGYEQGLRRVPAEARPALQQAFNDDELAQLRGAPPAMQRIVSLDTSVRAAYRSQAMLDFHDAFTPPPGFEDNDFITLRSTRLAQMYEPGHWVSRIAPKPLLMIVADDDVVTPTDLALAAYERALQPKRLHLFKGGHFDAYLKAFDETCGVATQWFVEHL